MNAAELQRLRDIVNQGDALNHEIKTLELDVSMAYKQALPEAILQQCTSPGWYAVRVKIVDAIRKILKDELAAKRQAYVDLGASLPRKNEEKGDGTSVQSETTN
jgi:hypothetical protein